MKDFITTIFPPPILDQECKECISIYMPTHRTAPDNRQDLIVFKNLVNDLEEHGDFKKQVAKLKELEKNLDFWMYNLDGLAILMSEDDMNIYRLPSDVPIHLAVGKRFYLKPLIRNYQSSYRYYALGLARDSFRLYSGNRFGFREVEIPEEKRLLKDVIGDQYEEGRINVVSQGGSVGNFHGDGGKSAEIKIDTEKFFYYVDDFVNTNYSQKDKLPLILVSLKEHQGLFRALSKNNYLLEEGVMRSYDSINDADLTKYLQEVIEPIYEKNIADYVKEYNVGINKNTATNTIQTTLEAIVADRVRVLVLQADKQVKGKVDLDNVSFELTDDGEDILNYMAQLAIARGAEVIILPKDKMPDHLSVFALLRY